MSDARTVRVQGGKEHEVYPSLLDRAHSQGLTRIHTELIQIPTEENGNVAICKATVEMESGTKFDGIGDASPENVSRNIQPHTIRMSETRAKARALRDAVNIHHAEFEGEYTQGHTEAVRKEPRASGELAVVDGGYGDDEADETEERKEL